MSQHFNPEQRMHTRQSDVPKDRRSIIFHSFLCTAAFVIHQHKLLSSRVTRLFFCVFLNECIIQIMIHTTVESQNLPIQSQAMCGIETAFC
jgi:hypothetical protein